MNNYLQLLNPRFYFSQIKSVLSYLFRPSPDSLKKDQYGKWPALIALFLFAEIISFLLALPKAILEEVDWMRDLENILSWYSDTWPEWRLLLIGGLFAPLLEELAFRLPLRYTSLHFFIGTFVLWYYVSGLVFFEHSFADIFSHFEFRALSAGLFTLGIVLLHQLAAVRKFLKTLVVQQFKWIYWSMILLFAFFHLDRYTNLGADHLFFIPIIVLPQLMSGSVFAYIRMKYGFWYGLAFHVVGNSYLILLF